MMTCKEATIQTRISFKSGVPLTELSRIMTLISPYRTGLELPFVLNQANYQRELTVLLLNLTRCEVSILQSSLKTIMSHDLFEKKRVGFISY